VVLSISDFKKFWFDLVQELSSKKKKRPSIILTTFITIRRDEQKLSPVLQTRKLRPRESQELLKIIQQMAKAQDPKLSDSNPGFSFYPPLVIVKSGEEVKHSGAYL
jgi:hypothetical protein